jgi:hypothetical protein
MNIETIIHPVKTLAEFDNDDVAAFLRTRDSRSEGPNLEFKSSFPRSDGEYNVGEVCRDIVAFLNSGGGFVIYGVSDGVNDPDVPFPNYISGLDEFPSPQEVNRWIIGRIRPPVDLPLMRMFDVEGRKVAVLEVPPHSSKPYCYQDPISGALWYFKRSGVNVSTLTPDEVREFYATAIVEQAARLLRSGELVTRSADAKAAARRKRVRAHQKLIKPQLENILDFGFVGIYALLTEPIELPWNSLQEFFDKHRFHFSEEMRLCRDFERFQDGISMGYIPGAISPEVKSTWRATLYQDGMVAVDSQADEFMGKYEKKSLNPYWLSYQLQRHLQMTRALLDEMIEAVHLIVDLEHIEDFRMRFHNLAFGQIAGSPYAGRHKPVEREVVLRGVYPYDSDRRNIAMPDVKSVMEEVCRIFGYSPLPGTLWTTNGYLEYVRGTEGSR